MAGTKPRWKDWEKTCIRKAVEEKIQLKVMAIALGKTLTSISKKIKPLRLRSVPSKRGRLKGEGSPLSRIEKTSLDVTKMENILHIYAPLKFFQKGQLALKEGQWVSAIPLPSGLRKGEPIGSVCKNNVPSSFSFPLEYILTKNHIFPTPFKERSKGSPCYISLHHIENWAVSEGFQPVAKSLQQQGLFYWKEGTYFSKVQLLLYINRIRIDKKLRPLAFCEEETDLYAESPAG